MMTKKSRGFILFPVLLTFCLLSAPQQAMADSGGDTWATKLGRGFLNIISLPVEAARQIHIVTEEDNMLAGWTYGLVKGLGTGIVRTGAGVLEVVTFPFDWPDENKGPIIDPEYAWEKPGVKYS